MTGLRTPSVRSRRLPALAVAAALATALLSGPSSAATPPQRLDIAVDGTVLSIAVVRVQGEPYLAALTREQSREEKAEEGAEEGGAEGGADRPEPAGAEAGGETAQGHAEGDAGHDPQAKTDDDAEPPPRQVVLVDPRNGRTTLLADGLPSGARRLAALARDGATDLLLVATDDGLWTVDPAAPGAARRADGPGSRLSMIDPPGLARDGAGELAAVLPGRLLLLAAGADGAPRTLAERPLPRRAERKSWGVRISSPPVHPVIDLATRGRAGENAAAPCWAAGPEAVGKRRLRTLLFCAGAEDPVEAWSLLPSEETVTKTLFVRYAGRPLLVVLTRDKVGLFVKQRLRVFALAASRNRIGAPPLLLRETHCPLWHASTLGFADADGDGRDDLYLACDKGLVDQELRLEIYAGREIGVLDPRVRAVELDGEYSSWWFGDDWTGDGLPDLLAVRDGSLEVHAGTGGRRRPVDKKPAAELTLAAADSVEPGFDVEVDEDTGDGGSFDRVTIGSDGPQILGTADLWAGRPGDGGGDGRPQLVIVQQGGAAAVLSVLSPP